MTDNTKLVELAKQCERHAEFHLTAAADNATETSVDLRNIECGLACLDLADRLRSRTSTSKGEG